MAFKILSSEEKSLLNDNQLEQYEKELNLYQQRVSFIERLEILENADIGSYEPSLEAIAVINEAGVNAFKKPEHTLLTCDPVLKLGINSKPFNKMKPEKLVLPVTMKPSVQVRDIQKLEKIRPDLPETVKLNVAVKNFIKSERKYPNLLVVAKPLAAVNSFKKLKNIRTDVPDIVVHDVIDTKPFDAPMKNQFSFTKVSKPNIKSKNFKKPEKSKLSLSTAVKSEVNIRSFEKAKLDRLDLQKVLVSNVKANSFKKPEKLQLALSTNVKSNIEFKPFEMTKHAQTILPKMSKLNIEVNSFEKPEKIFTNDAKSSIDFKFLDKTKSLMELPKMSKPDVRVNVMRELDTPQLHLSSVFNVDKIETFDKNLSNRTDLPIVIKPHVETRTFKPLEKVQPEVDMVIKPAIEVTPFNKLKSIKPQLPVRNNYNFSIDDSKLEEILTVVSKQLRN